MQAKKKQTDPAEMDSIERLQQLGFNGSEARVYVTLLQHGPLSGYELAKVSGVPRANVYSVLQKLEGRGAVTRLDKRAGTRYAPVPFIELLEKLRQRYEQALEQTGQTLTAVAPNIEPTPITQFDGYDNLVETGGQILHGTRQRLMLAIWPEEAQALVEAVTDAEQRGVDITTLCLAGCREVCGYCRGRICRYPFGLEEEERWLLLVADDEELLAGSVQPTANTVALRTRQPFLVQLAAWYIRQSIAVATLITDLSLNLDETMGPQTRETLAKLLPPGASDDWLEHMRELLRHRPTP
jgi:HTH-type transcriptional regulator, sugar sensing transcriptional regulator